MSGLLESGYGGLERIFGRTLLMGAVVPLVVAGGASALVLSAVAGWTSADALKALGGLSATTQVLLGVAALVLLAVVAQLLALFTHGLTQLYEGYWPALLGPLADRRAARHRKRFERQWELLATLRRSGEHQRANALAMHLAAQYPPPTRADAFLPTRLGNVLRAAELYPDERYGIDAVVIWPRLYPLVPEDARDRLGDARSALDAALLLRTLAMLFGVGWPVALLAIAAPWWLVVATLAAWPVAWSAHRAALASAVRYGEHVRVAFDLYRLELPRHLGLTVPTDLRAERELWDDLAQFYLRNLPLESTRWEKPPWAVPARGGPD